MGFKLTAFLFSLLRWVALVALALVPTIIVVVAYRKWRGQPLWSLADIPLAAEVTLAIAWLSVLLSLSERLGIAPDTPLSVQLSIAAAAAIAAAIPVAASGPHIEELRRMLGARGAVAPRQRSA